MSGEWKIILYWAYPTLSDIDTNFYWWHPSRWTLWPLPLPFLPTRDRTSNTLSTCYPRAIYNQSHLYLLRHSH